jgi:DNA-binding NtrC family response regulator
MCMETINILYLAPQVEDKNDFWPVLNTIGKNAYAASDLDKARRLLDEHEFQVGLVQFEAPEDGFLHCAVNDIIHYGQGSSMAWMALVSPDAMENESVCRLIAEYFHDYHTLPIDIARLRIILGHASGMAAIRRKVCPNHPKAVCKGELIGSSPAMQQLAYHIDKVVHYDLPVLISGESGTGKELVALAVHKHSPRASGPFVAINCGALPPSLIQSELFGHEKGAFTGAHQRKLGLLEQAAKGTLFLDEIGELPMELQANLLRVLQQKTLYRIGGQEEIPLDVRIISATHVDLEEAIRQGSFRKDLYYRLNVLRIGMPPLRERGEDIELLAQHFLETFKKEHACRARQFSKRALKAMRNYGWPGNVRELKNRIERALVMCDHASISPEDLDLGNYSPEFHPLVGLRAAKERAEKEVLLQALARVGNSVPAAAHLLDVSHVTLYRLVKKHAIEI